MRHSLMMPVLAIVLVTGRPVWGEAPEVESRHDRVWLAPQKEHKRQYIWLKSDQTLVLKVAGPNNVGLRCRELGIGTEAVLPVYLTVVRDQMEQGTVRFTLPPPDGAVIAERPEVQVSGEVLVKIEIPEGPHEYHLLVSGPSEGVLVQPFLGLRSKDKVIVATPGTGPGDQAAQKETVRPPQKAAAPEAPPAALSPPPIDILEPVAMHRAGQSTEAVIKTIIHHRPDGLGPATRTAGSGAAMFLVGTACLMVSGAVLEQRAQDEPVQIPAGRLLDRAERTYQASYVMGGLSLAAMLATLVFYLVEKPGGQVQAGAGGVEIRF